MTFRRTWKLSHSFSAHRGIVSFSVDSPRLSPATAFLDFLTGNIFHWNLTSRLRLNWTLHVALSYLPHAKQHWDTVRAHQGYNYISKRGEQIPVLTQHFDTGVKRVRLPADIYSQPWSRGRCWPPWCGSWSLCWMGRSSSVPSASVWILHSSLVSLRLLWFSFWSTGSTELISRVIDHQCMMILFFLLGLPNNTGLEVTKIMAKVPCKEDVIFRNSSFRKAVSRYVRCYSQVSQNFQSKMWFTYLESQWISHFYYYCIVTTSKGFLLNTDKWMDPTCPTGSSLVLLLDFKNRLWGRECAVVLLKVIVRE